MAWTDSTADVAATLCPQCDSSLSELSDVWGPFYACDECGYELDGVEMEMDRSRNAALVLASRYRLASGSASSTGDGSPAGRA